MRRQRKGRRTSRRLSPEINMTPLVDVMLVILIIFMVTVPLLKEGIEVELPESKGRELPREEKVTVSIKADGTIYLDEDAVTLRELRKELMALASSRPVVYLRADREVNYGRVVLIMGEVKAAGIEHVGIVTMPLKEPPA